MAPLVSGPPSEVLLMPPPRAKRSPNATTLGHLVRRNHTTDRIHDSVVVAAVGAHLGTQESAAEVAP